MRYLWVLHVKECSRSRGCRILVNGQVSFVSRHRWKNKEVPWLFGDSIFDTCHFVFHLWWFSLNVGLVDSSCPGDDYDGGIRWIFLFQEGVEWHTFVSIVSQEAGAAAVVLDLEGLSKALKNEEREKWRRGLFSISPTPWTWCLPRSAATSWSSMVTHFVEKEWPNVSVDDTRYHFSSQHMVYSCPAYLC